MWRVFPMMEIIVVLDKSSSLPHWGGVDSGGITFTEPQIMSFLFTAPVPILTFWIDPNLTSHSLTTKLQEFTWLTFWPFPASHDQHIKAVRLLLMGGTTLPFFTSNNVFLYINYDYNYFFFYFNHYYYYYYYYY